MSGCPLCVPDCRATLRTMARRQSALKFDHSMKQLSCDCCDSVSRAVSFEYSGIHSSGPFWSIQGQMLFWLYPFLVANSTPFPTILPVPFRASADLHFAGPRIIVRICRMCKSFRMRLRWKHYWRSVPFLSVVPLHGSSAFLLVPITCLWRSTPTHPTSFRGNSLFALLFRSLYNPACCH